MNINITSRKFKAKDSLKEFVNNEVKALEKYFDGIIDIDVVLSYIHEKDSIKTAEVIVNIPGKSLTITEDSEGFEKSISTCVDKMKRVLKKEKSKRISK